MKQIIFIVTCIACNISNAQINYITDPSNHGRIVKGKTIVIGHGRTPQDRFDIEIFISELLNEKGLECKPSFEHMQMADEFEHLNGDSLTYSLHIDGYNSLLIITIEEVYIREKKGGSSAQFGNPNHTDDSPQFDLATINFNAHDEIHGEVHSVVTRVTYKDSEGNVISAFYTIKNPKSREDFQIKLSKMMLKEFKKLGII